MSTASSYWCYRCSRFVRVRPEDAIVCPDCEGGFLEEVETPPRLAAAAAVETRHRRLTAGAAAPNRHSDMRIRRRQRASAGDRSPFNPVIVLRGPSDGGGGSDSDRAATGSFEFYYDDGSGSGLRPLPSSMSEFLMGSGFDRILDQLAQIEMNGVGDGRGCDHPPASKSAIESMPTVEIVASHISTDSHCAVCKEPFELGVEAREMPCKHIYHHDCILPWLSLRNSCPVCRHALPSDVPRRSSPELDGTEQSPVPANDDDMVGLTIWRLPGGGFAVGRFSGGRRAGERELPLVYTEMDGAFNAEGAPRRISWPSRGTRSRESGGIRRAFHSFFSFFRRMRPSSSRSNSDSGPSSSLRSRSGSLTMNWRRRPGWASEDGHGNAIARW
ncbi:E3 ubiquitin-protein ligase RDUF1-like [Phoenix dactylifera]|uniref:RING-type E3 ubiquitin transferase n=1 Tax=Phoenix dactylifera TaxID=42345 RepID=A0A8B7BUA3_PHODC|nr:E3 ubiquitin-protein ligase RDUF1-like [Phoenix dactylifera]